MQILNSTTVVVTTSEELKIALSEDNGYMYVYLGSDIELESGFVINENKKTVVIDGTYLDIKHTYTNNLTEAVDVITASATNEKIIVKDVEIISSHALGVISVPADASYSNVFVEYNKVIFNGIELSYNNFGTTRIIDSAIQIKDTNGVAAQRACDCNKIEMGGRTSINSSATSSTVFLLKDMSGLFNFLPDSRVTISTNKEIMNGTNKLNLKVSHGAEVNLVTGNGFAITTTHGVNDVLIEEAASFTFIEKSHQRVPMWNVYGNFTVNEGASVYILNTYASTPTDNYNIYFKGTNQKFTIDNPKIFSMYSKNADVIYTNNPVEFSLRFNRINMWTETLDFENSFTIYDLPVIYWYKEKYLAKVNCIIDKTTTTIISENFTPDELSNLPDMSSFSFQKRKIITIGRVKTNIHPITNSSLKISGHTTEFTDIKIEYGEVEEVVGTDTDGLFEYTLRGAIADGTEIKFTACNQGIYDTRVITTPFEGELTLLSVTDNTVFDLTPIPGEPKMLPKKVNQVITVVDSRTVSTPWKLYVYFTNPMASINDSFLTDALVFKKFDNEIVTLKSTPVLVYEDKGSDGSVTIRKVTFSTEKGLLVDLKNNSLRTDEEYSTKIVWSLEV